MDKEQLVEIARSFSYKYFPEPYKPIDFFCSQKAEVPFKDAVKTSEALYIFCKEEVMKSVNGYIKEKEAENTIDVDNLGGKTVGQIHEKGFREGYRYAKDPNKDRREMFEKKKGKDSNEKKEVASEMQMDNKSEDLI